MQLHLGNRIAPPRFVFAAIVLVGGLAAFVPAFGSETGILVAFDLAALLFLIAESRLFGRGSAREIRAHAKANDANRVGLLAITAGVMAVVLIAVAVELHGRNDTIAIVLVIATLALAWLFSNTVYALHYAHLYYMADGAGDAGGLQFPDCAEPDYWDFVYFSFCLGMTFQTSDVDVTSRSMRRVVTGQSLAAFVFNLGVIAFTINVLGG